MVERSAGDRRPSLALMAFGPVALGILEGATAGRPEFMVATGAGLDTLRCELSWREPLATIVFAVRTPDPVDDMAETIRHTNRGWRRDPTAPRFVVDLNVGRLAKWLRVVGYDAVFVRAADDAELLRVAMAQGRTILTRDRHIVERRVAKSGRAKVFLVQSDEFREQMREVVQGLGLHFRGSLTLCIECNVPLGEVDKESVRENAPPFVFRTQDKFLVCPQCKKLYWRGTHWRNMMAEMARFGAVE